MEIAVALLAGAGFEAFEEQEEVVDAYIPEPALEEDALNEVLAVLYPGNPNPPISREVIPPKDWNEEWERTFESIEVDDWVQVIPPFSTPDPRFPRHLIIEPKMSFGTGHHETTRLMIRQMRDMELEGKRVLDMGCGSGILAILAAQLGATEVVAIDVDEWSYVNTQENAALNQISDIEVIMGTAAQIPQPCYDIILANINRNVLLEDMSAYRAHLSHGGMLVLSGFLLGDEAVILQHYEKGGFRSTRTLAEGEWLSVAFTLEQQ